MNGAIEVKNLTKHYAGFSLKDVSFTVPCGTIVGFLGENGAGKTTTIKAILDVVRVDGGEILLYGMPHNESQEIRQDIGFVFDECYFHENFTIAKIEKIMKNIYKKWDSAYFQELLENFQLRQSTGKIKTFSRGMKMKLNLAVAMAHHPKLLILDEATSGLDPIVRDEILDMLLEFIQDEEKSVLFSTHITGDLEKAADYLVFIQEGAITMQGEKDRMLEEYGIVHTTVQGQMEIPEEIIVGSRNSAFGVDVLVSNRQMLKSGEEMVVEKATIEQIMLYLVKGRKAR